MNAISSLLRSAAVLLLAIAGIAMALVFMVSTAIALGVLYIVARLRGRPFAPAQFWQARRGMQWQFMRGQTMHNTHAHARANAGQSATSRSAQPFRPNRDRQVIDVDVREIH